MSPQPPITEESSKELSADWPAALAEEEKRVTPAVETRVGVRLDELADLFLLESVKGFGPQKFKDLHEAGVSPHQALHSPDLLPLQGKRAEAFKQAIRELGPGDTALARQRAVRQIVRAEEHRARILTYWSPEYPSNVFRSNNPIPVLYVRGAVEVVSPPAAVACVGSRGIRQPYQELHHAFAHEAVNSGMTVVSGFATGADTIGHVAAMQSGGRTILVMPCGLDRPFPPENQQLWSELLEYPRAAMVSEFPFGTKAASLTLRKRNKLIVAFALGVLLSQSAYNGGAMNAYRFALEQRKPIATFAVDVGGKDTSGNAAIADGLYARPGRGPAKHPPPPAAVFPLDGDNRSPWIEWLQQLSSST